jgi:predicted secreted protein
MKNHKSVSMINVSKKFNDETHSLRRIVIQNFFGIGEEFTSKNLEKIHRIDSFLTYTLLMEELMHAKIPLPDNIANFPVGGRTPKVNLLVG